MKVSKKQHLKTLIFVLALVSLSACQAGKPTPAPASVAAKTSVVPVATGAASNPSDVAWDDRSIFRAGLIGAEQGVLDQLPGASVYHLDVQIADDLASLQGHEQVRYTNRENQALDVLYFQLFPNMSGGKITVSAVKVDDVEVQAVQEFDGGAIKLPLPAALQPGKSLAIQMDFKLELPLEMGGNYGLLGHFNDVLVLDEFYPVIPVYDDNGWHVGKLPPNADEVYLDASFYVVRATAPISLTVVASGRQVSRESSGNEQVLTFAIGPARDFYIAASDHYTVVSQTVGETTVNSYAFKERTEGIQIALRTAVNALKSYGARLGPYPYTEFDVASTPLLALGIEYPGLVGISLNLYDPTADFGGTPYQVMLESTVAHEVGHQWFYNIVGNDQINEPWLDESFAQYITGLYFLDMYGQSGFQDYRSSWVSRWQRVQEADIPIGMPAGEYQGREYGAIVYGRGPLFIEALAATMGQATFDKFLRDYYDTSKWGIGTAASFKQLAEKHCQCDLTPLFEEWVYKK